MRLTDGLMAAGHTRNIAVRHRRGIVHDRDHHGAVERNLARVRDIGGAGRKVLSVRAEQRNDCR
eukprot:scaffold127274_cov26-Prasinocladus_malaysianus.AAC.2